MNTKMLRTAIKWDGGDNERWNYNESVTKSSCMVQVYGYNRLGLWLPTNLFRCWGGEPQFMGSQLINHLYPLLLKTNRMSVGEACSWLENVLHLTGTPSAIDVCHYLYVIVPSHKSIKCFFVQPQYIQGGSMWDFHILEEVDLKQYKKMKPVEFFK